DDLVTRIDDRGVRGVDDRARAAGDERGVQAVVETERLSKKRHHRLARLFRSVRRRVIRLAGDELLLDELFQAGRNAELLRGEISDGEVADVAALFAQGAHFAGDLEDFRSDQAAGEGREGAIFGG